MQTIWKGAISFGLVNIPVKLYAATEDKNISFKQYHRNCGGAIGYEKKCKHCEAVVAQGDIVNGLEHSTGQIAIFEKEELEQVESKSREIKILNFINEAAVDPIYLHKTYYLGPEDTGVKAYALLRESLQNQSKAAIAQFMMRSKTNLAILRYMDNCLLLSTLFYADEVRPIEQVPSLPPKSTASQDELKLAELLMSQLTQPFRIEDYQDSHREAILALADSKMAGKSFLMEAKPTRTNIMDLMEALKASLEASGVKNATASIEGKTKVKRNPATATSAAKSISPSTKKKAKAPLDAVKSYV